MKRFCLLLALCLLLAPLGVPAESPFEFDPQSGELKAYTGPVGEVVLPDELQGVKVLSLGVGLFDQNKELTGVTLPKGLRLIQQNAFYFCENLRAITLPEGLQAIERTAFMGCSGLEALALPASLAVIGDNAFTGLYGLKKLSFAGPPPLVYGKDAFMLKQDAPEAEVRVPGNHKEAYEALLGVPCQAGPDAQPFDAQTPESAFEVDASGALTGYLGEEVLAWVPQSVKGVAVTSVGAKAFLGNKQLRYLSLPEGLTSLQDNSLQTTRLMGLSLPESLTTIGAKALQGSYMLTGLKLPAALREIGEQAFGYTRLVSVELPEGLTALPDSCFARCGWLDNVSFPASLQSIGAEAFKGCGVLNYLIVNGGELPSIGEGAFEGTNLTDVDLAPDATRAQALRAQEQLKALGIDCKVWRANWPDGAPYPGKAVQHDPATGLISGFDGSVTEMSSYWNFYSGDNKIDIVGIAEGVFKDSALTRFDLPHSDKFAVIGKSAFENSQLKEIRLFDSLTTIGEAAFRDCKQLTELVLPDSVTEIGSQAFKGCSGLRLLVLPPAAQIAPDALEGIPLDLLRISKNATDEQQQAPSKALGFPWYQGILRPGEASSLAAMPDSYAPSPATDFEFDPSTGNITKYLGSSPDVVIPREIGGVKVQGIGVLAFSSTTVISVATGTSENQGLRTVVIPETVLRIGDSAFLGCSALETLDCWGPIAELGNRAFEECRALTRASFHNGVQAVGPYCFHLCGSLHQADLGDKLERVEEGAFLGCGFEAIRLSAAQYGALVYKDNARLHTVDILPGVQRIGAGAFQGTPTLRRVVFQGGDASILGEQQFQFGEEAAQTARIILPEGISEEAYQLFEKALKLNLLPVSMLSRGEPAASTPVPEPTAAPAPAAPAGGAEAYHGKRYVCVAVTSSGVSLDPSAVGLYDAVFNADGTAVLTIGGVAVPPLPYAEEGGSLVVDMSGNKLVFEQIEKGWRLAFFGQMILEYAPE